MARCRGTPSMDHGRRNARVGGRPQYRRVGGACRRQAVRSALGAGRQRRGRGAWAPNNAVPQTLHNVRACIAAVLGVTRTGHRGAQRARTRRRVRGREFGASGTSSGRGRRTGRRAGRCGGASLDLGVPEPRAGRRTRSDRRTGQRQDDTAAPCGPAGRARIAAARAADPAGTARPRRARRRKQGADVAGRAAGGIAANSALSNRRAGGKRS